MNSWATGKQHCEMPTVLLNSNPVNSSTALMYLQRWSRSENTRLQHKSMKRLWPPASPMNGSSRLGPRGWCSTSLGQGNLSSCRRTLHVTKPSLRCRRLPTTTIPWRQKRHAWRVACMGSPVGRRMEDNWPTVDLTGMRSHLKSSPQVHRSFPDQAGLRFSISSPAELAC